MCVYVCVFEACVFVCCPSRFAEIVILEHAALEGVDEVEAKRPFVFSVGNEDTVSPLLCCLSSRPSTHCLCTPFQAPSVCVLSVYV